MKSFFQTANQKESTVSSSLLHLSTMQNDDAKDLSRFWSFFPKAPGALLTAANKSNELLQLRIVELEKKNVELQVTNRYLP